MKPKTREHSSGVNEGDYGGDFGGGAEATARPKKSKRRRGAPLTQRERIKWVEQHYTELVRWVGQHKNLSDFDFPDQPTHAAAQAMLASEENLKHFLSQAVMAEIKSDTRQNRAGVRDDLRRNLEVLRVLEKAVVKRPEAVAGRSDSGLHDRP